MSIFGVLLILYFIYYFIKNQKKPISKLYPSLFVNVTICSIIFDIGYIAKIGNFTLEFNYFFTLLLFCFSIVCFIKDKIPISNIKKSLIFIFIILISFVFNLLISAPLQSVPFYEEWDTYILGNLSIPYTKVGIHSVLQLLRIIMFVFEFSIFVIYANKSTLFEFFKKSYKVTIMVLLVSCLEILFYNFIPSFDFRNFLLNFFGHSEATFLNPRKFGFLYAPMAFMREPSSYSYMLFILSLANLSYYFVCTKNRKKILINICFCLLFIMISTSFSGILYLVVILFLIFCFSLKKNGYKSLKFIFPIILILIVFLSFNYASIKERFDSIFDILNGDKSNTSNYIRITSIFNNLNVFSKHMLLGFGVGSVYCFSGIVTILANIGIIGSLYFVYFVNHQTNKFFKVKYFSFMSFLAIFIAYVFSGHMSYLLYSEKVIFIYLMLKFLSIKFRKNSAEVDLILS